MDVVTIIGAAFTLAGKIIDIVNQKGDAADTMKLADIPGWENLKKKCRQTDAVKAFKKAWKERPVS